MIEITESEFTHQIAYAATFSYLLQKLKIAKWFPWVRQNNALVNRIISISIALGTAAGFTWTYHGTFINGGTLIIGIPSWEQLHQFIIHFASSMTYQEIVYRNATIHIKIPEDPPEPIPAVVVGVDLPDKRN